jgi:hypothetical protein
VKAEWKKAIVTMKRARAARRRKLVIKERGEKGKVRHRDGKCRFPRCGCQAPRTNPFKAILTVSHDFHKGMGGNPSGDVSIAALMILLCKWRHQDGPVSRHAGTMQTRYLTPDNNNGPVAFLIDLHALYPEEHYKRGTWYEVARETSVGEIDEEMLTEEQARVLKDLAEMKR